METVSVNKILQLFNLLSKSDQLVLADKIDKQTFAERWQLMDNELPNSDLSEDEIMREIQTVRY